VLYFLLISMVARCETIGKYVLPVFRSLVAKELISTYHLTQLETAQRLGTTQAAVSQYVNSKRANKVTVGLGDVLPKLQVLAKDTAKQLVKEKDKRVEITMDFCRLCASLGEVSEETGDNYSI
jgi:predicted transcriptional regulator